MHTSVPDLYRCKWCNYSYSSLGFLRRHLIRGCSYLPSNSSKSTPGKRQNVNSSSSSGPIARRKFLPKSQKCPMCSQLFKSRETLISHLRDTCGQKPKYKCPYCELRSKRPHNIKAHVRNKHEGKTFYLVNIRD